MARFDCDILINNGLVLTMDRARRVIENGSVAIKGSRIVGLGPGHRVRDSFRAEESVDAHGGIVMPGLINTHTRCAMTLFRGLSDDLHFREWMDGHILPAEKRYMNPENTRIGAKVAIAEMVKSGTTTFNDMHYFSEEVARAAKEIGARAVVGEVLGSSGSGSSHHGDSIRLSERLVRRWRGDSLVSASVAPHSVYNCSAELLRKCRELADRYETIVHINVSKSESEVSGSHDMHRKSPVEYLEDIGMFKGRTVAAHCVHVSGKDIKILGQRKAGVSHNPRSNMKLALGISPAPDLMGAGAFLGLGSDSAASNNDLNIFREMSAVSRIHKAVRKDPTVMDARTVVGMATINGARALGLDQKVGSLEIGKAADLIVLERSKLNSVPGYNPYSQIVYSMNGSEVRDSVINGKIVMRERKLLAIDEDRMISQAGELARRISLDRLGGEEPNYVGHGEIAPS